MSIPPRYIPLFFLRLGLTDRKRQNDAPRFTQTGVGRPSLTPGTYFRLLLIGYFEGIDSERGRTRHHKPHPWPPKAISITDQNDNT